MNNKNAEWQREYYLTHDKYRMQGQGTDCYKVVKSLTRILQLPTIAKLTTDNESVISDFRLNRVERGTIWRLEWCGGEQNFKELSGPDKMHITLPDEYVEKYFKKV